ncbi:MULTISPECIES: lipopolysaccharide biosynthesis protein [Streptococcus]|jgi:polysaccharide biosynthesis protein, probable transporter|uniref:Lipopolysaccharide biosynthesis protein n=2 Tax=Streptococcus TaxID=1301 RepID=A0A6A8V5L9_STRPA|nr:MULTISPECIES: lipopolysaccharide biosynthesis protein [Streptococcus]MTR65950.1 lipopolysaccharide biosynthesis protein [Streptococcus parasanguinis]MTR98618.1 lipopolysaccharide biosynthesis protein [Streptococcus parasanguinis]MTS01285.1 lipopolysaccharide biosynthesis protein [Streptococcus parasanguinis]MTS10483.1 lipopolysaccharide biosynthesis protein [Streptococcus parasanguinis]WPS53623.1 lipopolysaccharide biosynthesis protein [Streptococcus sp. S1]
MNNTPSQKSIYIWNLLGNFAAAAVSVLYLLIVSRMQTSEVADQFSLATSIGNLWIIIGQFQVRNYQATDVKSSHPFSAYYFTRLLTVTMMVISLFPYLWTINYDFTNNSVMIITWIIVYRVADAFSDLFQGYFQQHGRLDIAGKAMVYRYALSVLILLFGLLLSHSMVLTLLALALFNLFFVFSYDYAHFKLFDKLSFRNIFSRNTIDESFKIIRVCFSLFIYGFLLTLVFNEAKLSISGAYAKGIVEAGAQRDYNILFMPVFFMSLCILVVRPLITQMAELWQRKKFQVFYKMFLKILLLTLSIGIVITFLTYLIGVNVLSLIFGLDLLKYKLELTILVLSGVLYSFSIILENILIIMRKHYYLLSVYILMFIVTKMITTELVNKYQIMGASISFCIAMIVYAIGSLTIFSIIKFRRK